jgi:tetratricopeptide (TPR) repeat protein
VKRLPTWLLLGLFLGYATVFVRLPTSGYSLRPVFDPLAPRPRIVQQMIVAEQFAQALPLVVELRRSFPNEPQIIAWLAMIHRELSTPRAEASAWEDYVRVSRTPAIACPALPEAYARLGDEQQALAAYERCVAFDPREPDRLLDLANAYRRSNLTSAALELYRQAASLDPYNRALAQQLSSVREGRP